MKKNKSLENLLAIIIVAVLSIGFASSKEEDENTKEKKELTYNYVYHHIEGRYTGTFDDVYDKSDTKYSGYVDIISSEKRKLVTNILLKGNEKVSFKLDGHSDGCNREC